METSVIVIVAIGAAIFLWNKYYNSADAYRRQIWKIISRDRICRNADIGEKDIRLDPISYHVVYEKDRRKYKRFTFEISVAVHEQGSRNNPWVSLGEKYSVYFLDNPRPLEDRIAEAIKQAQVNIEYYRKERVAKAAQEKA